MDTHKIKKLELWLDELRKAKDSIRFAKGDFVSNQAIVQLKKLKIDNFIPLEVVGKKKMISFLNKVEVATCWLIYDLKQKSKNNNTLKSQPPA